MAAAYPLPAQVSGSKTAVSHAIPRRPPMREASGSPVADPRESFGELTAGCTGHVLELLHQALAQSDSVLEAARDRLLDGERTALSTVSHLMRKTLAVVANLENAASVEAGTIEDVDCNSLVGSICAELEPLLQDTGARVSWGDLPTLRTRRAALTFLIRELIQNAVNYRSADPLALRIEARRNSAGWIFRVDDNGIGIHPRYSSAVFEPFFTADPRSWRPGFGLAVARFAAQRLGGTLHVSPNDQSGCCFEFDLPS